MLGAGISSNVALSFTKVITKLLVQHYGGGSCLMSEIAYSLNQ
jgi:hypothetical protein